MYVCRFFFCTFSSLQIEYLFGKCGSLLHCVVLLFLQPDLFYSFTFTFYRPPVVKCVLVGSPGFVKDQFISYLFKEAVRQDNKVLLENRPKFMLVHSSSGHKYSLKGASWCALEK